MFRLSVDGYGVGVVCHPISDARRFIQRGAALVEVADLKARARFNGTSVRFDLPELQLDECRFTDSVGADDPNLVAALNDGRQVVDDG